MSALTTEKSVRNLRSRFLGGVRLPIKNAEVIYAGAVIAVVAGEWQNVTATTGLEGRYAEATETVDNTGDGKTIEGRFYNENGKWVTPFRNDTDAPVLAANLGDEVYFLDNQTVSIDDDGGARSVAGRVWKFGSSGTFDTDTTVVWVEVY